MAPEGLPFFLPRSVEAIKVKYHRKINTFRMRKNPHTAPIQRSFNMRENHSHYNGFKLHLEASLS